MKAFAPVVLLPAGSEFLFAKETHWAFNPQDRPAGKDVDFFVDSGLKAKKLTRSPPAEANRLLRLLNHKHLTYRHQGRDYRITDVHGRIVREILA